jgi:hypothetical protein
MLPRLWDWLARQWSSLVLCGTGWAMLIGAVRFDRESDALAGFVFALGTLVVLLGALHHRGLRGGAGPQGVNVDVPPDPTAATTARLAELDTPPREGLAEDEADDGTRWYLADEILTAEVLHPRHPSINDCRGQVWLYDPDVDALVGILEPGHDGRMSPFKPGQGVVGRAWKEGRYVIAAGSDVANNKTFNLSPVQQARYADLAAAAAMPVTNAVGRQIAVLSMSSTHPDTRLTADDGIDAMAFLSAVVSRVLVDLLKWFDDRYDEQP